MNDRTAYDWRPPTGAHLESYRVLGRRLVPSDPWPKINDKQSELVAWTQDADPNKLLVLMQCCQGVVAVFCTNSFQKERIVWERALLLERPLPDDDDYLSVTLLLNDLYLGTRNGNSYKVLQVSVMLYLIVFLRAWHCAST